MRQLIKMIIMIQYIYLDFNKALDRVPHLRLLNKVKAHGIDGKSLPWIKEWIVADSNELALTERNLSGGMLLVESRRGQC